jgi:hypothetical protein
MTSLGPKNNRRRNLKIAVFIFGALVFLSLLIYFSVKNLMPPPEKVILDGFDEIPDIDTGVLETDEPSVDITDPVDPLAVSLAAKGTDEIGLPGNDGPPEVDIPQHPYRIEQESS